MKTKTSSVTLTGSLVTKAEERREVMAWLSVIEDEHGNVVKDLQGDVIELEDLRKAAHEFMTAYRTAGNSHQRMDVGTVVESVVTDRDWQKAIGIPPGTMPVGWLVVVKVHDEETWQGIKSGDLAMMSIGCTAIREPLRQAT